MKSGSSNVHIYIKTDDDILFRIVQHHSNSPGSNPHPQMYTKLPALLPRKLKHTTHHFTIQSREPYTCTQIRYREAPVHGQLELRSIRVIESCDQLPL